MHPHPLRLNVHDLSREAALLAAILTTVVCASALSACQGSPRSLTVMTHDSFSVSADVLSQFEQANGVKVTFLKSGDAGAALNKAILTKNAPLADVLYGVDNTLLSRALQEEIFEPYDSPLLDSIPEAFQLDSGDRALPVDYGDVCINYDKDWFAAHSLPLPQSLEDLARPEYKGLLVTENPATSSTGLAFLLATVAHFGPGSFQDYWKSLKENGLQVVDGWETAYYTNFSGSSGKGPQPLVVSYASSPVAEVVYAPSPVTVAPTGSLTGSDMCFRQIEFVGILAGTPNRVLAEKFVDFMLGTAFQNDMPLQMYVFPVNAQAVLPEVFTTYASIPLHPAYLSPGDISARRDEWITLWEQAVLP